MGIIHFSAYSCKMCEYYGTKQSNSGTIDEKVVLENILALMCY